jgi:chemotaxis response regulator CheB
MRVLVVHSGLMLTAGIEDILAREKDLRVKGISSREYSAVLREIAVFQPDVLIVDENPKPGDLARLLDQMTGSPHLRIIVVNKHSNRLHIYEKKEFEVTRSADLIAVIWSQKAPPPCSGGVV